MPRPHDRQSLLDILTHSQLTRDFVHGIDEDTFNADTMRQMAVIRALEIIGEASHRLSPATRAAIPQIPWRDWIDFRNRLSHGYDDIRLDIVWVTVTEELPVLIAATEDILTRKLPGE